MKKRLSLMLLAMLAPLLAISPGTLDARQKHSLDAVLGAMDKASREFVDMVAAIERETVTVFINHSRIESGRMYFARGGDHSRVRVSLTDPARKDFLIDDGKVRIYNPGTNVLEEIGLGEHADKVELMVVGFGTSGEDLLHYYDVKLAAEEIVDGTSVSVLDLAPRDPDVARHFTSIRLWMDQQRWIPVQTRATQSSGDYLTVRFSNVVINGGVPNSAFSLDLPDDVQILRP
jgi:outer membrane lipoprotein-sorting protein